MQAIDEHDLTENTENDASVPHLDSVCTPFVEQVVFQHLAVHTRHFSLSDFECISPEPNEIIWLHCVGVREEAQLRRIIDTFHIHPLVIEDILSIHQRPKVEDYGHYVFFVGRVFGYKKTGLVSEPVSMIIGKNFFLSFQNHGWDGFATVRNALIANKDDIRSRGADFLAYSFIDHLVDDYFNILDKFNMRVEKIDRSILDLEKKDTLQRVHRLKRDGILFRSTLLPIQESLNLMMQGKILLFKEDTRLFLRDVVDHVDHLVALLNSTRELITSMMDVYLSYQSNKLNEQMRVLTAITIIFMPLTLVAGIYGMNFTNMPELDWRYGYFFILLVMLVIAAALVMFFRKRRWF
ncbi:magnesium/cobalt transporter CorA [Neisseria sp. Ec49-e6-T10]|uniref:magnesium/cobalt transporter CorA n=1 Tax=Neisseria sp. Ec49-e6-T10 TaxID=3140744 RepID=UPI003EBBFA88